MATYVAGATAQHARLPGYSHVLQPCAGATAQHARLPGYSHVLLGPLPNMPAYQATAMCYSHVLGPLRASSSYLLLSLTCPLPAPSLPLRSSVPLWTASRRTRRCWRACRQSLNTPWRRGHGAAWRMSPCAWRSRHRCEGRGGGAAWHRCGVPGGGGEWHRCGVRGGGGHGTGAGSGGGGQVRCPR